MSDIPPPPWLVAGCRTVWLEKYVDKKELHILVEANALDGLTPEQTEELVRFVAVTKTKFERVVPEGWRVLA